MAALDDVMNQFLVDPARVILTGLSMGGTGAWELAASRPRRFAAVVPICGIGKPESSAALASIPVRGYIGDADRERSVLNLREMTGALDRPRRQTQGDRIPRRRPQQLGPSLQRPRTHPLDASAEKA